jgi:glutathione reductase (NADPH)
MQSDLIVIGTGSAAGSVAYPCRSAGWSVTVIDSRPFGGTCQLRGCDPKKVLVGGGELVDWNRRMQGKGVSADDLTVDWPDLMRFKRTFTDRCRSKPSGASRRPVLARSSDLKHMIYGYPSSSSDIVYML